MKKMIYGVMCLVLCMTLVFSLTACKIRRKESTNAETEETAATEVIAEPETAVELWERIDSTMSDVKSYEMRGVIQFTMYYNGLRIDASAIADGVLYEKDGDHYSYNKITTDMSCAEMSINEKKETLEAYYDGKMYLSNVTGDNTQKFCSEMTYEEFSEDDEAFMGEMDILDCTTKEFSKGDDGAWELKFSGYTKKAINAFLEESDMTENELGASIVDMEVTVGADSEFCANNVMVSLVFDVDEDSTAVPVFVFEAEYSEFNNAEPNYQEINVEEYTEIDDVRILEKVGDGIKDIQNAKKGSFVLDITQKITAFGEESEYTEKDTVSFEEINGGYTYEVEVETSDGNASLSYKNGAQTITDSAQAQTIPQSDEEAKALIDGLIATANFDATRVSSVEKTGENVYVFTIDHPNETLYKTTLENLGVEYKSVKQTITVTMKDDAIQKMESSAEATGVYNDVASSEAVTMNIDTAIVFGEIQENIMSV